MDQQNEIKRIAAEMNAIMPVVAGLHQLACDVEGEERVRDYIKDEFKRLGRAMAKMRVHTVEPLTGSEIWKMSGLGKLTFSSGVIDFDRWPLVWWPKKE